MSEPVLIRSLHDAGGERVHAAALDRIFFEASSISEFADEETRSQFRTRWLGRYLTTWPEHAFLAFSPSDRVAGYVVGTLSNAADDARFADIPYFRAFACFAAAYPAHLHINVDRAWRGRGVGGRLIAAFAAHARAAGAPGLHIVTGHGMRNVGFYRANGFREVQQAEVAGKALVMLGLDL